MVNVNEDFMYKYMNANAPTGYEYKGQQVWIDYVKNYVDEIFTDPC